MRDDWVGVAARECTRAREREHARGKSARKRGGIPLAHSVMDAHAHCSRIITHIAPDQLHLLKFDEPRLGGLLNLIGVWSSRTIVAFLALTSNSHHLRAEADSTISDAQRNSSENKS